MNLTPKYATNESGEIKEVILPIVVYESLLEDISDLAAIVNRRHEPTISHQKILSQFLK